MLFGFGFSFRTLSICAPGLFALFVFPGGVFLGTLCLGFAFPALGLGLLFPALGPSSLFLLTPRFGVACGASSR